jgi:sulfate adenylyltransferase subunit 1 (EFTu-like GTPase family)
MPVISQGISPVVDSGKGIHAMLKEDEQAQQSMAIILDSYASDRERGLGVPASFAQFNRETREFVSARPEKEKEDP